jgi:hypothetical protein
MKPALNKKSLSLVMTTIIIIASFIMSNTVFSANATSMKLDTENITISVGDDIVIAARIQFDDSTDENVRLLADWTSSNPAVATVDRGSVEALSEGKAVITAEYNGVKASATVTVVDGATTDFKLSESSINIDISGPGTFEIHATAKSSSGIERDVTEEAEWTSSDSKVAIVQGGIITGKSTGTATITATYKGSSAKATVNVKESKITKLTLSKDNIEVLKDVVYSIKAEGVLEDGSKVDVSSVAEWKSSDENIFVVEEGQLSGVSNGNATLTASYKGFTATSKVIVGTSIVLQIGNPKMNVMGTEKEIDPGRGTTPIVRNGRTLIPIRALIEELGGTVEWDDKDQKVTIELNMKKIELWINKTEVLVDAEPGTLDVGPIIVNGRTVIPLRFVSETMGYKVNWDAGSQKVTITD